jgi:hypothetical protein
LFAPKPEARLTNTKRSAATGHVEINMANAAQRGKIKEQVKENMKKNEW